MKVQVRAKAAMEIINAQVQKLGEIHRQGRDTGDATFAFERLKRWKQRTVKLISEQVIEDGTLDVR
jgi:hypothetical protein